ncbi:MAG: DUF805 domain-containing protein [Kiritimatiellia bacterium]
MRWFMFCWQRLFDYAGRSRRREYWLFLLFDQVLAGLLLGIAFTSTSMEALAAGKPDAWAVVALVAFCGYSLAALLPYFAVTVRRFHDVGRSGWWLLLVIGATLANRLGVVASLSARCETPFLSDGLQTAFFRISQIAGWIWIYLLFTVFVRDGQPEENRYGPSPKSLSSDD